MIIVSDSVWGCWCVWWMLMFLCEVMCGFLCLLCVFIVVIVNDVMGNVCVCDIVVNLVIDDDK